MSLEFENFYYKDIKNKNICLKDAESLFINMPISYFDSKNYIGKIIINKNEYLGFSEFYFVKDYVKNNNITIYDYLAKSYRLIMKEKETYSFINELLDNIGFSEISGVNIKNLSLRQIFILNIAKGISENKRVFLIDKEIDKEYIELFKKLVDNYKINVLFFNVCENLSTYNIDTYKKEYEYIPIEYKDHIISINELQMELNEDMQDRLLSDSIKYIMLDKDKLKEECDIDSIPVNDKYYPFEELIYLNENKEIISLLVKPFSNQMKIMVLNSQKGLIKIDKDIIDLGHKIDRNIKDVRLISDNIYDISNNGLSIDHIYSYYKYKDFNLIEFRSSTNRYVVRVNKNIEVEELFNKKIKLDFDSIKISLFN